MRGDMIRGPSASLSWSFEITLNIFPHVIPKKCQNIQRMKCNLMCKYQKSNVSFSRWNCTGLEILPRISLSESSSILQKINMKGAYFDALMFDSSNASFLYFVAVKIYLSSPHFHCSNVVSCFQKTVWVCWSRAWWWWAGTGGPCRGPGGDSPSGRRANKSNRE